MLAVREEEEPRVGTCRFKGPKQLNALFLLRVPKNVGEKALFLNLAVALVCLLRPCCSLSQSHRERVQELQARLINDATRTF